MANTASKKSPGWDIPRLAGAFVLGGMGFVVLTGIVLIAFGFFSSTGNDNNKSPTEHAKANDVDTMDFPTSRDGHVDDPSPKDNASDRDGHTEQEPKKKDGGKTQNLIMPFHDRADFLGSVSEGQRFCIIADNSNSVAGAQLAQLTKEIMRTLSQLKPTSQFYVIYFNKTDFPMPHSTWLTAEKENIEKVRPWIEKTATKLGTLPNSAFERAFRLDPRPDCIFFMTDGILQSNKTESTEALLARLNAAEPKVKVNTILFTRASPKEGKTTTAISVLRRIAENNAGTFRRVSPK